jgi:hypothetical protein
MALAVLHDAYGRGYNANATTTLNAFSGDWLVVVAVCVNEFSSVPITVFDEINNWVELVAISGAGNTPVSGAVWYCSSALGTVSTVSVVAGAGSAGSYVSFTAYDVGGNVSGISGNSNNSVSGFAPTAGNIPVDTTGSLALGGCLATNSSTSAPVLAMRPPLVTQSSYGSLGAYTAFCAGYGNVPSGSVNPAWDMSMGPLSQWLAVGAVLAAL